MNATSHPMPVPSVLFAMPFVALLLAIAILPLGRATRYWWEHHHHKLLVGLGLGAVVLTYYGLRGFGVRGDEPGPVTAPGLATIAAVLEPAGLDDYVPFIVLLFSLYVIAGGLQVRGDLVATPG